MKKGVGEGRIRATDDAVEAINNSESTFFCVGTPSNSNGSLDLEYVRRVSANIGNALKSKDNHSVVVVRSTMLPGSTEEVVIPILEETSGKKCGVDFGVCFNPEFLRQGSSIKDFNNPPYTIISTTDSMAAEITERLYSDIDAPMMTVPFRVAEMVKYTNNAFHALNVIFANEIGNICKRQGIDSHQVMDIFCMDRKLNLFPGYLSLDSHWVDLVFPRICTHCFI